MFDTRAMMLIAPVAIILCADRKSETVEYLDMGRSGIHVAQYLTDLPSREVLRNRFHQAISAARASLVEPEEGEGAHP